jgi:division protein CdvB (Snf7/Vps24/ESCRT-III family)
LVAALIETSSLSGDQIDAIIARVVAMRSMKLEHQRRAEWQRTTESAARFTLDHKTRI